jgi:DNA (cytosine-5)-methyltransferase 1
MGREGLTMRYGSVCSGIEAATVAWHPLGWQAAWYSEIEPFPCAVLKHHYPHVPNYGDMTKFEEWPNEPIELLVGGTPCQSFSVAGLRRGLADPRGNLMLTYLAIAQRHRPRWLVWENVPGVLSSNGGRDFGTFLGALGELGYGFAYRVLDAQWFGVAQRRRRVFVVGYLGDWRRAAEVLFESESVSRHPAPSREARQGTAQCLTAGVGKRFDPTTETLPVVAETLIASDHKGPGHNRDHNFIAQPITFGAQMSTPQTDVDMVQTLQAKNPMAVAAPAYGIPGNWIGRAPENGGNAVEPMLDVSPCQTKTDIHAVAQPVAMRESGQGYWMEDTVAGTIDANMGMSGHANRPAVIKQPAMQVRRLTPVECERLQGFPDGYTNIPWRKATESPDGPRYKALGNSMAVPVMTWIGRRIANVENT